MEEDRAQVDLGIAVDVEEQIEEAAAAQRQPKKRFVGRKQATEAALKNEQTKAVRESGAIQGKIARYTWMMDARNTELSQYQSQEEPLEPSTRSLPRSSTTQTSMPPSPSFLRTTPSRFTKLYTEYERMGRRRLLCRCQRGSCFLRRPYRIFSHSSALESRR